MTVGRRVIFSWNSKTTPAKNAGIDVQIDHRGLTNVENLLPVQSVWRPPPIWALRLDSGLGLPGQNICNILR